ncbi:MAG: hypothetical protein ACK2UI_00150, partial [Anaerolineae bacterium]
GDPLLYTLRVRNLGQQATSLVITDTLPVNVTFDTAYNGGTYNATTRQVRWQLSDLAPGAAETVQVRVVVDNGPQVINADYAVTCEEGVTAVGSPQITIVTTTKHDIYLPLILRSYSP